MKINEELNRIIQKSFSEKTDQYDSIIYLLEVLNEFQEEMSDEELELAEEIAKNKIEGYKRIRNQM